jgi:ribosomal protein S18 acetylase RimI-like enzyme
VRRTISRFHIRPLAGSDRPWAAGLLSERWGSPLTVTRGRVWDASALPGFIAEMEAEVDGAPVGLVTYRIEGEECEIVSLDSLREGVGVGTALLEAVQEAARRAGCQRVWLITTNDNTPALRFFQKRGFRLAALYVGALAVSRQLKPEIPLRGVDSVPLRDEIELELPLS